MSITKETLSSSRSTSRKRRKKAETGPKPKEIRLPYLFKLRNYQAPLWRALDEGTRRAVIVWHRRAGKDLTMFNYSVKRAWERVGVYYHLLPTYTQGKRIIWDGVDNQGRKFLDYIPGELIEKKNETELKIAFKNGSIYQIIGTDQFNGVVGPNPIGCIFSEFSLQNPRAWDLIRPILAANEGWAVFIFTPRGKNHAWELYEIAKQDPGRWFCQALTANDTKDDDGFPVITRQAIDAEISDGMDPALVEQEFYCSFNAPMVGSYYGKLMDAVRRDGRVTNVPYESSVPVNTWWDLGIGDSTAIWFTQTVGHEIRVIDYLEASGEGLTYYAKALRERDYLYGRHGLPHDAEIRELGTGKTRAEVLRSMGVHPIDIVPNIPIDDGISAARVVLPKCWFDQRKCQQGIRALEQYQREYDDKNRCFKDRPLHDWSSHGADAFRYLAVGIREHRATRQQTQAVSDYDPFRRPREIQAALDYDV